MSESETPDCPFCGIVEERLILYNALAFAVFDAFPVSAGHSLVIPRRHSASFFDLTNTEIVAVYELMSAMQVCIRRRFSPAGYNIGINVGLTAGQTISHPHVHLIPRYSGDVSHPEGGVRNVIPGKGQYR